MPPGAFYDSRMRYNVRDLLGHWVKPKSERNKMCPHACCRNKRVHPANFPVILPKQLLRRATETELIDHYGKHANNGNARRQILAEIDRRDRAEKRRQGAAGRAAARRMERESAQHQRWLAAEAATKGYMVNARGKARGITERQVLTSTDTARRYGTDELLAYLNIDRQAGNRRRARAFGVRRLAAPGRGTGSRSPATS